VHTVLEPDIPPGTVRFGWVTFLLASGVGLGLAIGQGRALMATWKHCIAFQGPPVLDMWIGGERYVGIMPFIVRFVGYATLFVVGVVGCGVLRSRGRAGRAGRAGRPVLGWVVGLGLCLVAFVIDFSVTNGMGAGSYDPFVCPGGHLRWWPL